MTKSLFIVLASALFLLSSCGNKPTPNATPKSEEVVQDENHSTPTEITSHDQFDKAIHSDGLTLVDFHATWCGPCKMMHPILEKLCKENYEGLKIIKVDIDDNEDIANEYQIQAVPTLLLFKNGSLVWNILGATEIEMIRDAIKKNI